MSINISNLEDKENLIKDRLELQNFLKDIQLLLHINKFTDKKAYIEEYKIAHQHLNKKDLDSRIDEIENIFYAMVSN